MPGYHRNNEPQHIDFVVRNQKAVEIFQAGGEEWTWFDQHAATHRNTPHFQGLLQLGVSHPIKRSRLIAKMQSWHPALQEASQIASCIQFSLTSCPFFKNSVRNQRYQTNTKKLVNRYLDASFFTTSFRSFVLKFSDVSQWQGFSPLLWA